MIRKIVLDNFMSHSHSEIDLAEGLTVLIGPNNCGKSAVVEAIRVLCSNASGDFMVRHGEKECRVAVTTDDDHHIVWIRKGKTVSYEIDGEAIHRLDGGVPKRLHELLRLPKVEPAKGDPFDIHFGLQKSPIFLLNEAESRAAVFFSSASDAEKLVEMQQRHRDKSRLRRANEGELQAEVDRLSARLASLETLDPLSLRVEAIEKEHQSIQQAMAAAVNLHDAIHAIEAADESQRLAKTRQEVLTKTKAPPAIEDESALESLCRSIEESMLRRDRASAVISALQSHLAPPGLVDFQPLKSVLDAMELMAQAQLAARKRVAAFEKLAGPSELLETAALQEMIGKIDETISAINAQRREVAALNDELSKVKNEIHAWAEANPLCPTCGAAVDPERIASMEHAHE